MQSHMISDGTYAYVWTAENPMGMKFKSETMENPPAQTQTGTAAGATNGSVYINQQVNMNCSPWAVDESVFVPPANVQFTDFSQSLKNAQDLQKSPCEAITDPAVKAACVSATSGKAPTPQSGY